MKLNIPAMLLVLLVSACYAGSKETAAVATAVAVDQVLQTNTPDLPKTPLRPRGETQEQAKPKIVVTVRSPSSFACPPCAAMKADAKANGWEAGDSDIEIVWVTGDSPEAASYPWITSPGKINLYGRTDIRGLRMWLGLPAVKPSRKAIE